MSHNADHARASRTQVLVVGGGPAGSAVAWLCAQQGLSVRLVDRAHFPRRKACAEYVSPGVVQWLQRMGVLERLAAQSPAPSPALDGMHVHAPGGGVIAGSFERGARLAQVVVDRTATGRGIPRETLDAVLLQCARDAGVDVCEGFAAEHVCVHDGLVVGVDGRCTPDASPRDHAQHRQTYHADLVIGADGLRSVVARRLGLAHTTWWPRRYAFVAHYRGIAGMGPHGEMHVHAHHATRGAARRMRTARTHAGYVGLAPVGDDITNVALVVPAALARAAAGRASAFLDEWLAAHPALGPRLQSSTRQTPVLTTGPFASHARHAARPGVALTGDAADFFDPFTGEGVLSALSGSTLLAEYVADAVAGLAADGSTRQARWRALRGYAQARANAFRSKWRLERLIGLAVASPRLLDHAARIIDRDPSFGDLLVGATGGVVPASTLLRPAMLWRFLTT